MTSASTIMFYSGRITTLVAMVTYSFHKLIIEKWKLTLFSVLTGIFGFLFLSCVN